MDPIPWKRNLAINIQSCVKMEHAKVVIKRYCITFIKPTEIKLNRTLIIPLTFDNNKVNMWPEQILWPERILSYPERILYDRCPYFHPRRNLKISIYELYTKIKQTHKLVYNLIMLKNALIDSTCLCTCTCQARIQAGALPAPPPPKKKEKERERKRERGGEERGSKEETKRSIRGKTFAEAFVISF